MFPPLRYISTVLHMAQGLNKKNTRSLKKRYIKVVGKIVRLTGIDELIRRKRASRIPFLIIHSCMIGY